MTNAQKQYLTKRINHIANQAIEKVLAIKITIPTDFMRRPTIGAILSRIPWRTVNKREYLTILERGDKSPIRYVVLDETDYNKAKDELEQEIADQEKRKQELVERIRGKSVNIKDMIILGEEGSNNDHISELTSFIAELLNSSGG